MILLAARLLCVLASAWLPLTTVETSSADVAVLDELVERALAEGDFPSLVVGVVRGDDLVYAKAVGWADRASERPAQVDTPYRIGSVTKVFTTTLMAQLRDEGTFQLDDPIARYLPDELGLPSDPRGAPAITLRHLATHSSGLPGEPVNRTGRPGDAWNGYSLEQLYEGLPQTELAAPVGAAVLYSNLGFGLLGHVLERAADGDYEALVEARLLEPLDLHDTAFVLDDDLARRLSTGYSPHDTSREVEPWSLGCLSPAGGLVSTVPDLARFLSLQFRAGQADVEVVAGGTLAELHRPQRVLRNWGYGIGLGWFVDRHPGLGDVVRHNGGMAGHRSHVSFAPRYELGVVVLTNVGWNPQSNGVDQLGRLLLVTSVDIFGDEESSG